MAKAKVNKDKALREAADAQIGMEIMEMVRDGKMPASERQDLYALAGYMASMAGEEGLTNQDFVYMYMKGDRDWKKDFKEFFGRAPGKAKKTEKFSIDKVQRAVVQRKKD